MSAGRILFVEDNAVCQLETSEALRRFGFDVVEAGSAAEAQSVIEERSPLAGLLTDVDLGAGADGYAVARCGRAAYPRLAVVYISAGASARHRAEGVTGSEFIAKPFHSEQVAVALERMIHVQAA